MTQNTRFSTKLTQKMIPKAFQIGPITLHVYGLIMAFAIFLAYVLAKNRVRIYKLPQTILESPLLALSLLLSLIFARAYHVLDNLSYYSQNPGQIPAVWNGGIGILGGLLGFFAGLWLFSKIKKLSFLTLADLLSPSVLLAQAIGRIGNFINQEAFGPPTALPWGVFIKPENRPFQYQTSSHFHPAFFYEAILEIIFFLVLVLFEKRIVYSSSEPFDKTQGELRESRSSLKQKFSTSHGPEQKLKGSNNKRGQIFGLYLTFYSLSRSFAELFRIDTATVDSFKIAYLFTFLALISGLLLLKRNAND